MRRRRCGASHPLRRLQCRVAAQLFVVDLVPQLALRLGVAAQQQQRARMLLTEVAGAHVVLDALGELGDAQQVVDVLPGDADDAADLLPAL